MKLKKYHPLANGLVCSYLFNEHGGNQVYDSSGNQNHAPGTNLGWGRDGLDLPGVNEHILIPNFINQEDDKTIFISFIQDTRIPDSQTGYSSFVRYQDGTGAGKRPLIIDDKAGNTNKLKNTIDGLNHISNTVIEVGVPYTAGITQNGTSNHFYLNGKDDGSFTATPDAANGDIVLFDRKELDNENCFDGTVRVFYIYDRPLSANEMRWLDADPTGMFEPNFTPAFITESGLTLLDFERATARGIRRGIGRGIA